MPTYTEVFTYTTHSNKDVTHTLEVVEEPDVPNNRSMLTISIIRKNSGDELVEYSYYNSVTCKLNDSEVYDSQRFSFATLAGKSEDKTKIGTYYIEYSSSSSRNFNISVKLKCDEIVNLRGWTLGIINSVYGTHASTEISGTCTPIDQSPPQISGLSVKADRYGLNASASFTISHESYILKDFCFTLSGLTSGKVYNLYNKGVGRDFARSYPKYKNGIYSIDLFDDYLYASEVKELSTVANLDGDGTFPFDSGGSYPWELTVTAYNGKSTTISGVLKVPQKVTGVTCESQLDLVPGQTAELEYTVFPGNAEYPAVDFVSGDESVATVDANGKITAIGEGVCQITVITRDGGSPDAVSGYAANCIVNVLDTETFPKLTEIRYLSTREISKFSFACTFLREKLLEKGVSVDDLVLVYCKGKNHPVKEVRNVLDAVKSNCVILNNAVKNIYPSVSLSDSAEMFKENISVNWFTAVNEWIRFLNELNKQIEKEV